MLELKRGGHTRVQTEKVEFVLKKLKIWSVYVVVFAWTAEKCTKKPHARAELLFCQLNLLLFDVAVPFAVVIS